MDISQPCSYPNPEIFAALELGLNLAKETGADLMLATDPDADRVGIAMKCPDGSYELVSGNEVGVLLLDYIAAGRIEKGTMPGETGSSEISRIYTTCRCSCRALRSRTSQRTDRIQMDRRSDCEPRGSRRS